MSDQQGTQGFVRRAGTIEYESVDAAEGLRKGVLVGAEHGAPNVAIRRFTLEPGGSVPRHTNEIEHEQYVLAGEYRVGIEGERSEPSERASGSERSERHASIEGEEYAVGPGDAVHVPAGAVHWYENEGAEEAAFICAVPTGDDAIELVED